MLVPNADQPGWQNATPLGNANALGVGIVWTDNDLDGKLDTDDTFLLKYVVGASNVDAATAFAEIDTTAELNAAVGNVLTFLAGDANKDSLVSADDFASVQQNFGSTGLADGSLLGDANGDGLVSADDFASIQQNFGSFAAFAGSGQAIPEPASLALLGLGGLSLLARRRAQS